MEKFIDVFVFSVADEFVSFYVIEYNRKIVSAQ